MMKRIVRSSSLVLLVAFASFTWYSYALSAVRAGGVVELPVSTIQERAPVSDASSENLGAEKFFKRRPFIVKSDLLPVVPEEQLTSLYYDYHTIFSSYFLVPSHTHTLHQLRSPPRTI